MATRKETLLIEVYNLRNQICSLKGKEQTNIDDYSNSAGFRKEANLYKEYELKIRIEELQLLFEQTKREVETARQRETYYATEEGKAYKADLEQQLKDDEQEWTNIKQTTIDNINTKLQTTLGEQWAVIDYQQTNLRFGVRNSDSASDRDFIFGQEVDIYYDPRKQWNKEGERFEMNFGSCGSFDILPESDKNDGFAEFHIGIGRLLADRELCEWLRTTLRETSQQLEQLAEDMKSLRDRLDNPTKA